MQKGNIAYIYFLCEINQQSMQSTVSALTSDLNDNIDTLYFIINTNGGSVAYGIALYNFLKSLPHRIIMHNMSEVDSIGNVVFMAGDERYATENATFLIHPVNTNVKNELHYSDLKEKMSSVNNDTKRIKKIILDNTDMDPDDLASLLNSGKVKTSEYALNKKIIHEIRDLIPYDQKSQSITIK